MYRAEAAELVYRLVQNEGVDFVDRLEKMKTSFKNMNTEVYELQEFDSNL